MIPRRTRDKKFVSVEFELKIGESSRLGKKVARLSLTIVISVSPPFQLATSVPVLESSNDMAPVEKPIAIKVSD